MITNPYDSVGRVFNPKEEWEKKIPQFQQKIPKMYGEEKKEYNPFTDKYGNIFNPFIDYQKILDNPNTATKVKSFIQSATGLSPNIQTNTSAQSDNIDSDYESYTSSNGTKDSFSFNSTADENNLAKLDVTTELPKLSVNQISDIISKHFSKSTVIKPSDAEGIYNAQQTSGMSALAILGIGALESGYGTSNIAKKKNNLWGWNATNVNPSGNATTFSQMSQGALEFANKYLNTYYNKYGAKSIYSAGTGSNPAGKGYAYNDDGSINSNWATQINSIMKSLYQTAKTSVPASAAYSGGNPPQPSSDYASKVGSKIANTGSYNNSAAPGQCVWYVRGRMKEKFGIDWGSLGNANEVWYNAPKSAKLTATSDNIKPNTVASYKVGSSGSKYGHVIYIEDVVGDTVYFTEGGSVYHKNGTDGTVKKTTKQAILNGSGGFGSGLIGLIDITRL